MGFETRTAAVFPEFPSELGATVMDVPMTCDHFRELGFHPDAPVYAALEHLGERR